MSSKTYIIILNWMKSADTIVCLESIIRSNNKNFQIVLIENGSSKEERSKLQRWTVDLGNEPIKKQSLIDRWGKCCVVYSVEESMKNQEDEAEVSAALPVILQAPLIVIESNSNLGFAEGNNVGIRYALNRGEGDYVWLLNSDTTIEPDTLSRMIEVMERDSRTMVVQSMLLNFENRSRIDSCGIAINNENVEDIFHGRELTDYHHHLGDVEYREIFGACAASALFRSSIFREIGLLDKNYFTIYEDVDLAFRIRMKGYKAQLAENAIVYHKRGITSSQLPQQRAPEFWRYIRKRSVITLKLKFWQLNSILKSLSFYLLLAKAIFLSIKRGVLLETLNIWFSAIKFRMAHRYDRAEMFKMWNSVMRTNVV